VPVGSTIQTTRGTQDLARKTRKGVVDYTQPPDYWAQKLEEARQRLASLQCESEKLESAYDRWKASNVNKTVKFESFATNNKPTHLLLTTGSNSLNSLPLENLKTLWNRCDILAPIMFVSAFSYPFESTTTCNTVTTEKPLTNWPIASREILISCLREPTVGPDKASEKQSDFHEEVIANDGHDSHPEFFRIDKADRTSPASESSIEINDVVENSLPPLQPTPVLSGKFSDAHTCEASCFDLESKNNVDQTQLCTSAVRHAASSSITRNSSYSVHNLDLPAKNTPLSSTSSVNMNQQQSSKTTEGICSNALQHKLSTSNLTDLTKTTMTDNDDNDSTGKHDASRSATSIRKSIHSPEEIVDLSDIPKPTEIIITHNDGQSSPNELLHKYLQLNQKNPAINSPTSEEQVAGGNLLENKQITLGEFLRTKQVK
ncbi:hypothetical protein P879_03784, partial [Paragonimus westermani]